MFLWSSIPIILSQKQAAEKQADTGSHGDFKVPPLVQRVFEKVSKVFPMMKSDSYMVPYYDRILAMVMSGELYNEIAQDVCAGVKNGA